MVVSYGVEVWNLHLRTIYSFKSSTHWALILLLLPSIMSKKKAIGATHIAIDIPTGSGSKNQDYDASLPVGERFVDLGKRLGWTIRCALTLGEQPLGCAVGPALEAREALVALAGEDHLTFGQSDKPCWCAVRDGWR